MLQFTSTHSGRNFPSLLKNTIFSIQRLQRRRTQKNQPPTDRYTQICAIERISNGTRKEEKPHAVQDNFHHRKNPDDVRSRTFCPRLLLSDKYRLDTRAISREERLVQRRPFSTVFTSFLGHTESKSVTEKCPVAICGRL